MIGCPCPVCQSADARDKRTRSSIFLTTPQATILVDTAPEFRLQALREKLAHLDAVLFTHPHADHIMGLDDLRRFCEIQDAALPIYASKETLAPLERIFPYAFTPHPHQKVSGYVRLIPHVIEGPFELGGLDITPLSVPHGAVLTLGFLFSHRGRSLFAYLSDCASVPEPVRKLISGVEVLIIDGLRDQPHPTHLTVSGAIEVARAVAARRSFLTHLTHEKSHVERTREMPPGVEIAFDGLKIDIDL